MLLERPRGFNELRRLLQERFPAVNDRALGYTVRTHVPLVMVPTDAPWGFPSVADFALADEWLGQPLPEDGTPEQLVLRYLAAFGPASAADAQTWSGLQGLAPVLEALRPQLLVFKSEGSRRELFDLPGAPRPDETSRHLRASCPSSTISCWRMRTAAAWWPTSIAARS